MSDAAVTAALQAAGAKYFDAAKRDIMATLQSFRDLHPGNEQFEFPDRVRRQAFRLKGTLPVLYKGNTYNIPVALYLWDTHPYYAPLCYVCPTPDMMVKASQSVDQSGKVYLPYLSEWRHPGYDLSGLIQVMTITFQESCPVFSRAAGMSAAQQPTPSTTAYPSSGARPAYTPYPSTPGGMPTPYSSGNSGGFPSPRPPYPPQPAQSPTTPYPAYPSYPASQPSQSSSSSRPYSQYSANNQPTPYPTYPTQSSLSTGTIQPEHIRASVLSAIEDRMRQRLREKLGDLHGELGSIRQTQQELRAGQQKLKEMLERLESEQSELESTAMTYQDKRDELKRILDAVPGDEELQIDHAVETTAPLHRQLLNCYVDDCTLEDSIYFLGQALKKGTIGLDLYLKCIRKLSRQQFIQRATMQKCRQKAGLSV